MKWLTIGSILFFTGCSCASEREERLYPLLPVDCPVASMSLQFELEKDGGEREKATSAEVPLWGKELGQLFGSTFNENWVLIRSLLTSIGHKAAAISGNEADCYPAIERAACVLQRDLIASMHSAASQIRHRLDGRGQEFVKQVAELHSLPGDFIQQAVCSETLAALTSREEASFTDSFIRQYMWWAMGNMNKVVRRRRAPDWGALAFDGTVEKLVSPDLSPEYDTADHAAWLEVVRAVFGSEYLTGSQFWKIDHLLHRYAGAEEPMLACIQRLQKDLCGRCIGAISADFPDVEKELAGQTATTELFLQQNKIAVADFLKESFDSDSCLMRSLFDTFATRYTDWARQKYREQRTF